MASNFIVLASGSPRRKDLLKAIGLQFKVMRPRIKETILPRETPNQLVRRLAYQKANSCSDKNAGKIILAADTIVIMKNQILGKPKNKKDATRMLSLLSGKTHQVLTGYCLLKIDPFGNIKQKKLRVVCTFVKIRKLSKKGIFSYFSKGESMDKAGSYAAQGFGMGLVESIRGSYTNVVGLPIAQLIEDLENEFGVSIF